VYNIKNDVIKLSIQYFVIVSVIEYFGATFYSSNVKTDKNLPLTLWLSREQLLLLCRPADTT